MFQLLWYCIVNRLLICLIAIGVIIVDKNRKQYIDVPLILDFNGIRVSRTNTLNTHDKLLFYQTPFCREVKALLIDFGRHKKGCFVVHKISAETNKNLAIKRYFPVQNPQCFSAYKDQP